MAQTLFALALIFHGVGHVMGFLASWTSIPQGFTDKAWVFSHGITIKSHIGRAFGLLWLAAMACSIGAGIALILDTNGWDILAVWGAVFSLVVMLPWWNTITSGARNWGSLFNLVILLVAFQNF